MGGNCLMGMGFHVAGNEKDLGLDRGGGCMIL